ncbi:unnamed protein product [Bursaphelenchus okinawaensis]|uniref:Uncharacterized protein n=1 Tax=Bursaphelenchus okinawaensis TaxID=465554 RepID=A0A811KY66_9BILA|nr:unnamed protein product [Bursaphelenchus okinawaensis]CAG9114136.1 unnamed protein product [Bursaphelenchus okinawaensis]
MVKMAVASSLNRAPNSKHFNFDIKKFEEYEYETAVRLMLKVKAKKLLKNSDETTRRLYEICSRNAKIIPDLAKCVVDLMDHRDRLYEVEFQNEVGFQNEDNPILMFIDSLRNGMSRKQVYRKGKWGSESWENDVNGRYKREVKEVRRIDEKVKVFKTRKLGIVAKKVKILKSKEIGKEDQKMKGMKNKKDDTEGHGEDFDKLRTIKDTHVIYDENFVATDYKSSTQTHQQRRKRRIDTYSSSRSIQILKSKVLYYKEPERQYYKKPKVLDYKGPKVPYYEDNIRSMLNNKKDNITMTYIKEPKHIEPSSEGKTSSLSYNNQALRNQNHTQPKSSTSKSILENYDKYVQLAKKRRKFLKLTHQPEKPQKSRKKSYNSMATHLCQKIKLRFCLKMNYMEMARERTYIKIEGGSDTL